MSDNQSNIILLGSIIDKLNPSIKSSAISLYDNFQRKGSLTGPQWKFVEKIIITFNERANAPKDAVQVSNFHKVIEIFDFAKEKGYKKTPKLRLGDKDLKITLSPAPDSGVNAGMVYVKVNDDYRGKISREGEWIVKGEKDPELAKKLSEFSMAPKEVARKYGFATGTCCVCGRHLTDKYSIENGIGPICAENWGL